MKFIKYFFLVLLTLIALAFIFKHKILNSLVEEYVVEVNNSDNFPLEIDYQDFFFNPLLGSLELYDLNLKPKKATLNTSLEMYFSAKSIKVKGLDILKLLAKDLNVDWIQLLDPTFKYYIHPVDDKKEINYKKDLDYTELQSAFKVTKMGSVNFINGTVEMYEVEIDTTSILSIHGYNIKLYEDYENPESSLESVVSFDSLKMKIGEQFVLNTKYAVANINSKSFLLNDVSIKNKNNRKEFIRHLKFKKPWLGVHLKTIELKGVQPDIADDINVSINQILVNNLSIDVGIRGDKEWQPGHRGKLINDWFMAIPKFIQLNELLVQEGEINVDMAHAPFEGNMFIPFKIKEIDLKFKEEKKVEIEVDAKIFSSPLKAKMNVTADSSYKTNVAIDVRSVKNNWLNKITKPTVGATFLQGDIERMSFNYSYHGLHAYAKGTMDFRYRNLKVNLQKRKHKDKKDGLLSFAANIAIKKNNYPGIHGYVKAPMSYHRPIQRDFFGHMIFTMLDGAEYSVLKKK